MLSKSLPLAITALVAGLFTSCSVLPWQGQAPANEVNLGFTLENNLIFLTTAEINNHGGRIFFGSAHSRTIVDPAFVERAGGGRYVLQLNHRQSIPFDPVVMSLGGVGDALVGADVWDAKAVTIDYRTGLLTWQKDGIYPDYMTLFQFEAEPKVIAEVDGRATPVVVDTALPDTLVLPRGSHAAGRRSARVTIAGTDFGSVDVALGDVSRARIGNRLLSKFLVSVDYGRRQVGLWRDPRIPM
ncbi:MAG TPA: hypothetical protein VLV78_07785 [Thermoanaerobaculia bacterium]|nr:hypothetical protein [Thermoanaerobaculia bacterium]